MRAAVHRRGRRFGNLAGSAMGSSALAVGMLRGIEKKKPALGATIRELQMLLAAKEDECKRLLSERGGRGILFFLSDFSARADGARRGARG